MLGVGNRQRGDDAAGPAVCDLVTGADAQVVDPVALDLVARWNACDRVVIVDASAPAGRPGRVTTIEPHGVTALPPTPTATSTHGIDVATAIDIARSLGRLPGQLAVIGIEGLQFEHGAPLSAPVAEAVDRVAAAIEVVAGGIGGVSIGQELRLRLSTR